MTRGNLIWRKRIIKRDRPLKTIVIARARAIIIGTIPDRFRWIETKPFLEVNVSQIFPGTFDDLI